MEEEKITIIEGPPPVFTRAHDGWAFSLHEGPAIFDLFSTRLRTFNGPALVERCHRVWSKMDSINLHYRNPMGLEERVPIIAARTHETSDGQVLQLWVRFRPGDIDEKEPDRGDDDEELGN